MATITATRATTLSDLGAVVLSVPGSSATSGVALTEVAIGFVRKTTIALTSVALTLADNGSNGSGGTSLYTFTEGGVSILGAFANIVVSYGSVSDANLVMALGSVTAAADGTLTSTEANIIPSTAAATTSGAATVKAAMTTPLALNGSGTAAICFINMATSTDPSTNNAITLSGTIDLYWIWSGDGA